MALAHQISLIDLRGSDFDDLRNLLEEIADMILNDLQADSIEDEKDSSDARNNMQNVRKPNKSITQLFRLYLRRILETWPVQLAPPLNRLELEYLHQALPDLRSASDIILSELRRHGEFFVGMANGPFILLLKPDDYRGFLRYAKENPYTKL